MSNVNSVQPPTSGPVAGKFQLTGLIGRGGMGSVWEGRHMTLGTRVAIKFIESEYANSPEARNRFDREARAAATIESKHAIKIYDHGVTDDGKPFIVMERLDGEPLDKRIDRMRALTLQDTARILQQVCRGLARAHERGIVHRDLKPENIFLTRSPEDDDEVVKVLDFGIAKELNNPGNPGMTSSTKTGAVLGTPYYMSPEQARGLRNVDHRTDLWSIGVIAFKCLAGKLPFDGESVGDLLVKICTSPVPVPSQLVPGVPSSFDAWFLRALERDPERRFQSAQELGDALAYAAGLAVLRGGPLSGSGPQPRVSGAGATIAGNLPMATPADPSYGTAASPGAYRTPSPNALTPAPGAGLTNAPFTSSASVPGVPSGRWKIVAVAALGGLLIGGGLITATVVLRRSSAGPVGAGLAVSATATTSAAAVSPVPTAPATTTPTAPEPPVSATAPGGGTVPVAVVPSKPGTGGKTAPAPKPTPGSKPSPAAPTAPAATTPQAAAPAVTPAPTPTTTPTAKKPGSSKDPGY